MIFSEKVGKSASVAGCMKYENVVVVVLCVCVCGGGGGEWVSWRDLENCGTFGKILVMPLLSRKLQLRLFCRDPTEDESLLKFLKKIFILFYFLSFSSQSNTIHCVNNDGVENKNKASVKTTMTTKVICSIVMKT